MVADLYLDDRFGRVMHDMSAPQPRRPNSSARPQGHGAHVSAANGPGRSHAGGLTCPGCGGVFTGARSDGLCINCGERAD